MASGWGDLFKTGGKLFGAECITVLRFLLLYFVLYISDFIISFYIFLRFYYFVLYISDFIDADKIVLF